MVLRVASAMVVIERRGSKRDEGNRGKRGRRSRRELVMLQGEREQPLDSFSSGDIAVIR
jgi:hypothetical protein